MQSGIALEGPSICKHYFGESLTSTLSFCSDDLLQSLFVLASFKVDETLIFIYPGMLC